MKLIFPQFEKQPNIRYGITEQSDGSMYLSVDPALECINKQNRTKHLARMGLDVKHLVQAKLVHGKEVRRVSAGDMGKIINAVDGMIANEDKVILGLTAADCFPIFFYDPVRNVIGIAHAGWRGTVKNVVKSIIGKMQTEFGCRSMDIQAGIGPGIRSCHFSIKPEIVDKFPAYATEVRHDQTFVDLPNIIKRQLIDLGVTKTSIDDINECTYCLSKIYYSHRRDQADPLETMLAYITMGKPS